MLKDEKLLLKLPIIRRDILGDTDSSDNISIKDVTNWHNRENGLIGWHLYNRLSLLKDE